MDLVELRYFMALVEEQHFTRAAMRLGIAQPALSQRIRRLEVELGLALVERTTRRVSITPAGLLLAQHAEHLLRDADEAVDAMRALRGLESGRVVVGVTQTPGAVDVAEFMARFNRRYPGIDLDVREALSLELLADLERGALDVAIVTVPSGAAPSGVRVEPLTSEPLVAVVPPAHELASRATGLRIEDLRRLPLVTFHRGATIRSTLETRAMAAGLVLRFAFETADVVRMRALVAHGLAIAVLPESEATSPGPRVAVLPLEGATLLHGTAMAVRRVDRDRPAAAAFADVVRESCAA